MTPPATAPAATAPARPWRETGFAARHRLTWLDALPFAVALACYFVFPSYMPFGTLLLVTVLFALSLDLVLGYAGIVTLGHAAFFGAGAYTVGILNIQAGWGEPISGLLAGAAVAGLVGLASGWVLLRTHGLTLLMLTLATAAMLQEASNQFSSITGGFDGLNLKMWPILGLFPFDVVQSKSQYLYVLAVLLIGFFLTRLVIFSPFGHALTGIRENTLRMPAVGAPVHRRLVVAYALSAALAGAAGALFAQSQAYVNLETLALDKSAGVLIMLILGGYGRLYGAFIGVAIYLTLEHTLSKRFPTYWQLGIGIVLMAVALFAQRGILGIVDDLFGRRRRAKAP
jgi:branched-chain amino acid transport system permease protein